MLTDIDNTDWSSLRHAHGSASDIPELLKLLADHYDEERLGILHETLWHQGTIYSASAAALPFLFEIAAAGQLGQSHLGGPDVPTPGEFAASLICCIATGEGWLQYELKHRSFESVKESLNARNRNLEIELEVERQSLFSIRETMEAKSHILVPYLDGPEGLGKFVAEVLELYPSSK